MLRFTTITALLFCGCLKAEDTGLIHGRILHRAEGPLVGASVTIWSLDNPGLLQKRSTDADGEFEFKNLAPGEYGVRAYIRGWKPKSIQPVSVSASKPTQTDIYLDVADLGVEGELKFESLLDGNLKRGDVKIPNARICAVERGAFALVLLRDDRSDVVGQYCTVTDRSGWYALSVRPGIYVIEVDVGDGPEVQGHIDMTKCDEYRDRIKLDPKH
jgi:hypothetical protein